MVDDEQKLSLYILLPNSVGRFDASVIKIEQDNIKY